MNVADSLRLCAPLVTKIGGTSQALCAPMMKIADSLRLCAPPVMKFADSLTLCVRILHFAHVSRNFMPFFPKNKKSTNASGVPTPVFFQIYERLRLCDRPHS